MIRLLKSIYANREFVLEITKKELKGKSKGALLGYSWLVISPLIQTGFYVLIVSFVFNASLGSGSGPLDYALYVLSGLIPWQIMTKALADAPMVIRSKVAFVKQVVYPVETLPLTDLWIGSFGAFVSFFIFVALSLVVGKVSWSWCLFPAPFVLLILMILGATWVLMFAGVIIKDIGEVLTLFFSMIVYVSPVVVNEGMVGGRAWGMMMLNPLSHVVICFRDVFSSSFHPLSWAVFFVMTLAALALGGVIIGKAKTRINEYI